MGVFDRLRRRREIARGPDPDPADLDHLTRWCETRVGVEGFVEPTTLVNVTSLCLVAFDGEWTRRDVGTPAVAADLCRRVGVPVFDVLETGYPDRMREFEDARRIRERRERAEGLRAARREDGGQTP